MTPYDPIKHIEKQLSEIANKLMSRYPHKNISKQFRQKVCKLLQELHSKGTINYFSVSDDIRRPYGLKIVVEMTPIGIGPYSLGFDTRFLQKDLYDDADICLTIV